MPQSLSLVLVHLVFSTRNHEPLIGPEVEGDLHALLSGIARDCRCTALSVGGTADHVHLLCSLSRTITIAQLVEELKTRSSRWIKEKTPACRLFHWQTGHGVFSVGKSQEGAVRGYIARQKEHQRKTTFQEEFRAFLTKYGVAWDEGHVWE